MPSTSSAAVANVVSGGIVGGVVAAGLALVWGPYSYFQLPQTNIFFIDPLNSSIIMTATVTDFNCIMHYCGPGWMASCV